jgi:hypothetical protein
MVCSSTIARLEPGASCPLGAKERRAVSSLLEESGLLKKFLPPLLLPFKADVDVTAVRHALQSGTFELTLISLRCHRLMEASTLVETNPTNMANTHLCTPITRSSLVAVFIDGADSPTPPFVELTFPTLLPLATVRLHLVDDAIHVTACNGSFASRPIAVPCKEGTNLKPLFTPELAGVSSDVEPLEPEGELPAFLVRGIMQTLIQMGLHHLSIAKNGVFTYPHVDSATLRRHERATVNGYDCHARTEIVLKMHRATCADWNIVKCVESKSSRAEILISACGAYCPLKPHLNNSHRSHVVSCIHRKKHDVHHSFCTQTLQVELRTWHSELDSSMSASDYLLELPTSRETQLKNLCAAACRWHFFDVNLSTDQRMARRMRLASEVSVMQGELPPLTERDLELIEIIRTRRAGMRGKQPPRLEYLNGNPMDAATKRQIEWILRKIELPAKPLKRSRSASSLSSKSSKSSCGSIKSVGGDRSGSWSVGHSPNSQSVQGAQAADAGDDRDDNEGRHLDDEDAQRISLTEDLTNSMVEFIDVSGVDEARRQIAELLAKPNLPTFQRERGELYLRILDAFEAQSEVSAPFRGINVRLLKCNYTQRSDGGRLYPQTKGAGIWDAKKQERRTIALQAAPRELRPFLAGRFCHDLDMRVAHPQIIRQLVHNLTFDGERRAFNTSELDDWCNKRDDYIEHIAEVHRLPTDAAKWPEYRKDAAKLAVLLSIYGGSYAEWKDKILVEGLGRLKLSMVHEPESPRIKRLHKQITVIRQAIFDSDQWCPWVTRDKHRLRLGGKKSDEEAISRSTFSRVIHKIEDGILMSMRRFLAQTGHRTMSLQFDGLLVAGGADVDYDLKSMSEAIQMDTGYHIGILEKELFCADAWPQMRLDRK